MKKTLKTVLCASLILALALSLTACGAKKTEDKPQSRLEEIRARGTLVIATEGDWNPWTYHDENDKLVGLDVELGALIAEGLGVQPEYAETDWDSILAGVDSGRFDIACNGVDLTSERAQKYTFSVPYIYPDAVLVVRAENEDIHTLEDLQGRTTANSPASTYADMALEYGAEVTYISTLDQTIDLLLQGRVEATINARASIEGYMEKHPEADIKIVQVIEGDPVAFPMQAGEYSRTLAEEVDRIMEGLRADGTLARLSEKYFGADLTNRN